MESLTFFQLGANRCRLDGHSTYTSPEHCTEVLDSGEGVDENFDGLDDLVADLNPDSAVRAYSDRKASTTLRRAARRPGRKATRLARASVAITAPTISPGARWA